MHNKQLERELKCIIHNLKGQDIIQVLSSYQKQSSIIAHKEFSKSGLSCISCTLSFEEIIATGFGRTHQESLINATKNMFDTFISQSYQIETLKKSLKFQPKNTNHNSDQPQDKENNKMKADNVSIKQNKEKVRGMINQRQDETIDLEIAEAELNQIREMPSINIGEDKSKANQIQICLSESTNEDYLKNQTQKGCKCVYFEIHQHHMTQIKHLEARMKLISKENQMLKQLLLKDYSQGSVLNKNDANQKLKNAVDLENQDGLENSDKENSKWMMNRE